MQYKVTLGSLFDGSGTCPLAARMLGAQPVWASEIEQFPIAVTKANFPNMKHYGDITKMDGSQLPVVDIITGGSPCFPEGTLVLTKQMGYIPIEQVDQGMHVLTHKCRWRQVTKVGSKTSSTVTLKGNHFGLECTPNHPIYSALPKRTGHRGIRVLGDTQWTSAEEMAGKHWATPSSIAIEGNQQYRIIEDEKLYFIGRWLGDGWVRNGQRSGRSEGQTWAEVIVCDSLDKKNELIESARAVTDKYSLEYYENCVKLKFHNRTLCDLLVSQFGSGAHNKTIPSWVYELNRSRRQALLDGILDSDGHKYNENKWRISTVSKKLAFGIRFLAETLGMSTTVYKTQVPKKKIIQGRSVNQSDYYTVEVNKHKDAITEEGLSWYKCRSVKKNSTVKTVYNMSVDEDESYIADGIVVHNCQDLSVAGARKGLIEGERSSLFFEQIRIMHEMRQATNGRYPQFGFWQNVPGALSSNGGADFREVIQAFVNEASGRTDLYVPQPKKWSKSGAVVGDGWSIAWRIIDAQYIVPQRRRRVYLVCDFGGDSAGKVLFERKGLSGNHQPCGAAWEGTAANAEGSSDVGNKQ